MRKTVLSAAAVAGLALPLALAGPAAAHPGGHHDNGIELGLGFLRPVAGNHVHGFGVASAVLRGDTVRLNITAVGLLDDAPHAMHFHIDGKGTCPTRSAASDHNGHRAVSTVDGQPAYGSIGTSLTTSGDTSPASALAVDRFPSQGTFHYHRTIQVTPEVVDNIKSGKAVVVVHGIDYNRSGGYDGVLGASQLAPNLPLEATAPALCGALK